MCSVAGHGMPCRGVLCHDHGVALMAGRRTWRIIGAAWRYVAWRDAARWGGAMIERGVAKRNVA